MEDAYCWAIGFLRACHYTMSAAIGSRFKTRRMTSIAEDDGMQSGAARRPAKPVTRPRAAQARISGSQVVPALSFSASPWGSGSRRLGRGFLLALRPRERTGAAQAVADREPPWRAWAFPLPAPGGAARAIGISGQRTGGNPRAKPISSGRNLSARKHGKANRS